jgi:hypothetical protein
MVSVMLLTDTADELPTVRITFQPVTGQDSEHSDTVVRIDDSRGFPDARFRNARLDPCATFCSDCSRILLHGP